MMGAKSMILLNNFFSLILVVISAVILSTRATRRVKQCIYKGVFYEPGSSTELGPCTMLYCYDRGVYDVVEEPCMSPCAFPLPPPPGQCCPVCEDSCEYEGNFYKVGNHTIDPCTTLICDGPSSYYFESATCAPCAIESFTTPGECCPICQDYCEYGINRYELNSDITINDCFIGYCNENGDILYAPGRCCPIECPNPVHVDGQCCRVCEKPYCKYEGEFYEVGLKTNIDPNTTLICTDPYSYCLETTSCETYDTTATPGESCSICQEIMPDALDCQ